MVATWKQADVVMSPLSTFFLALKFIATFCPQVHVFWAPGLHGFTGGISVGSNAKMQDYFIPQAPSSSSHVFAGIKVAKERFVLAGPAP